MNILIFDTETVSLNKPFCYNVGYVVYDTTKKQKILTRDYVIEQVWHNLPLFETAYYHDKRPLYVSRMRGKTCKLEKFGIVCQQLKRDLTKYHIKNIYAYNSQFDIKVFDFNCNWYKCINPLENLQVFDIRGYALEKICKTKSYKKFCEEYELFTEKGNYKTTAESVARFIYNSNEINEEHTALSDSLLELEILEKCLKLGAKLNTIYEIPKTLKRERT